MENCQKELIFDFFMYFSKFEYALKMTGHHCGDGNARADWESFGRSIDSTFFEEKNKKATDSIRYFKENPPNKQIVSDGQLGWCRNAPSSDTEAGILLLYVGRVRNNLFHGGKYRGHLLENPVRSRILIESSIYILKHALSISEEVNEAFKGNFTQEFY